MLAMLFGCGFRRSELVGLELDKIQMRQGHWAVVDLIGKGGHIRTVPSPTWVKAALDQWTRAAGVLEGKIFRAVARRGKVWGSGLSQNVVWYVVRELVLESRLGDTLHHTTCGGLVRSCATIVVATESRFSSCWATHRFKRQNAISAANRISDTRSTIFSTSQKTDGRRKTM